MSTSRYVLDPLAVNPIDRSVTRLLYISIARYSSEWNSILHTHPCAEVFFVTDGSGFLKTNDQSVPISTNDVITVNSNIEHTEVSSDEHPLEYIVMGVDGLEVISGENGENGCSIVHFQTGSEQILFYLRSLLKEIENKYPGYNTVCQDLLEVVLLLLMRHSQFTVTFVPAARKSSKECAIVRRYIENHFKENLTLDDLAALAHISKYYLVPAFNREYPSIICSPAASRKACTFYPKPRCPCPRSREHWDFPPPVTFHRVSEGCRGSALWNTGNRRKTEKIRAVCRRIYSFRAGYRI